MLSVIVISAILLTLIFTLNLSSFFARFDALSGENKRVSLGLAEACIEAAKLKAAQNASYAPAPGGDCVSVSDTCGAVGATKTCRTCNVTHIGNSYTFMTRAAVGGSYTNLTVTGTIATSTFSVTGWSENTQYLGPICAIP